MFCGFLLIFQDFLSLLVAWFLEWKSLAGSKLLWFSVKCFYAEGEEGEFFSRDEM